MHMTASDGTLERISLEGTWQLELFREDAWIPWEGGARLPGSLAVQRIGNPVTLETPWTGTIFDRSFFEAPEYEPFRQPGRLRIPFWLQPEAVYVGPARYTRDVEIPLSWEDRRMVLHLERPHGETRVWLDGVELGVADSLSVPHEFELGEVAPGVHRLTLEVDNRLKVEVGENAHSVSDHTQGNWNGVIGAIELRSTPRMWLADLQVYPSIATGSVRVRGWVRGWEGPVVISISLPGTDRSPLPVECGPGGAFSADLSLGTMAPLWDEFTPTLHTLVASLPNGHTRTVRFGLREIAVAAGRFLLNGRPVFFRGTLDCCCFPLTGHPPMDVASWRRIFETIKRHGLNHVRFHSWCPPEAAFDAADEVGLYLQVEAATWPNSIAVLAANSPSGIGDGQRVDQWTLTEAERILRTYGNHPSFVLMAAGNEPGGPGHAAYLAGWVSHMRAFDRRRLYTGASGWPELPENQFHVLPEPRAHQWGDGLASRLNALPPATTADYRLAVARRAAPVIAHEIGQWCSYPLIGDTDRYTGHLQPSAYEVFAAWLSAGPGVERLAAFVEASGRLQALCYKEEIEAALRTPGLGGFQLLGLQDFPGQGTAPVGVLDAFWNPKSYTDVDAWRQHCGPVVPLARLPKRVFTVSEMLDADLEMANFGPQPLPAGVITWELLDGTGQTLATGRQSTPAVPLGNGFPVGRLAIELRDVPAPQRCTLRATMEDAAASNAWDVWVFSRELPGDPRDSVITSSLSQAAAMAEAGGRVLLLLPPEQIAGDVQLGFTPIFWNTSCTQGQAPHTLGLLCDPAHPALAEFPTESHANWQWWSLLRRAAPMVLDSLPGAIRPVVEVIDDWNQNRRLGLVVECRMGQGSVLICSIDLADRQDPVIRQFRHSLLQHLSTPEPLLPAEAVTAEQLRSLLKGE